MAELGAADPDMYDGSTLYNGFGNVTETISPDGKLTYFAYNLDNQVTLTYAPQMRQLVSDSYWKNGDAFDNIIQAHIL